jgi:hypothetical protein
MVLIQRKVERKEMNVYHHSLIEVQSSCRYHLHSSWQQNNPRVNQIKIITRREKKRKEKKRKAKKRKENKK